ncbi:MAG TPA: hypothetical protein VN176_19370 [Verrucomicrobiae bacterium]|jgi:hypothetical protein|nr:hypothetical protein [Verrucomicrobiae bacterium]
MKTRRTKIVLAVLLMVSLAGSVFSLRAVDEARGGRATLDDVLYIRSGKVLQRASLGYRGLLADIYWTRAVQYFGAKHGRDDMSYDLLYPLLDITTDLDPHLIVAYQYGSIFLSQPAPDGAGQPEKAVALVEKGIRANPEFWRLYFSLGCIHYFDRKDYKSAEQAFEKGSTIPGAYPWMKVMAATMAQHANEPSTAELLWTELYRSSQEEALKDNALKHLTALRVDRDVNELERRVRLFSGRTGRLPGNWSEMIHAGLLRSVPRDPANAFYRLMPDGTVQLDKPGAFPFVTRGIPPGWKKTRQ